MRPPFPEKLRRQRRRLKITAVVVACFALSLATAACGSWLAQLLG